MTDKDVYIQKWQARLDECNAEIARLKAKADAAGADSREAFKEQIEVLQQKRKDVEDKIREVVGAGDEALDELKSGIQGAWDSMEEALKSARSKFK